MKFRNLFLRHDGSVSVVAALSLIGVIGMAGLAVDLNRGYERRIATQRVADMAALAAAVAYKADGSQAILRPTAVDLVTAHGIIDATIDVALLADTPEAGAKAVRVELTTPLPFSLSRILGAAATMPVKVSAMARLAGSASATPCILGLASSGNAVETQGGATINATDCSVVGAGSVNNGGSGITAKEIVSGAADIINNYGTLSADLLRYAGSFSNPSWNGNVPAADKRINQSTAISDPLANSMDLATARQLLGTFRTPRTIANPVTPACADIWTFGNSPSAGAAPFRQGNSAKFTVPAGNYCLSRITIDGGITVTFQAGSTVTVANGVSVGGGSTVNFGDNVWRINGGFNSGSSGVTFGNGEVSIGAGTVSFAGTNRIGAGPVSIAANITLSGGTSLAVGAGSHGFKGISVGGGSWMTLGDGDLDVAGQIRIDGDSTLIAGTGNYTLANAGSDAITLSGSGRFFMGDGLFSANGNIVTAGGSRLVFGKTANHLINGNLSIAGSVLFGAGRYTVSGGLTNGTGGTTWPYTSPITNQSWGQTLEGVSVSGYDMAGVNVSFILGGTINLAGGARTKLIAPTSSVEGAAIADILVDSLTSQATNWGAGSQNVFSGVVHLPNSAVTMSGGNNSLSAGQCFTLIAYRVTASGGANAGTACKSISDLVGGSGGDVELVA